MRRYAPLVAASALFVTVGGIATASDNGETIVACVSPSGLTFIVDDIAECGQNEMAMEWNTQGIPGEPGDTGPVGPVGPAGPAGDPGILSTYAVQSPINRYQKTALCNDGDVLLGGGFEKDYFTRGGEWRYSKPVLDADGTPIGWTADYGNYGYAWAMCGVTP